jgi:hypothetical protein
MAKLGVAMASVLALAGAPAPAAPPASAEEAVARQRASLRAGLDCDRGGGNDIVVCGRSGPDPNRLPLPVEPEPGARIAGEAADPSDALALTNRKCTTVGPNQQCSGGLPILGIAIWLVETAVKAAREEE